MPSPTHHEKPAAATTGGGLDLVWTTTLSLRKDSTHDLYHARRARRKP